MGGFPKYLPSNQRATVALLQFVWQYPLYSSTLKILLWNNAHPSSLDIFPCFSPKSHLLRGKFRHFFPSVTTVASFEMILFYIMFCFYIHLFISYLDNLIIRFKKIIRFSIFFLFIDWKLSIIFNCIVFFSHHCLVCHPFSSLMSVIILHIFP